MDDIFFTTIIEIIKKDDVLNLSKLPIDNLRLKNENEDTLLHYSILLNAYKCSLFLIDKIDPFSKNTNKYTPIDILQLKYNEEYNDDNNEFDKVLNKIKLNIQTRNLENIISNKIFSCLKFKLYKEIEFLLKLINIKKNENIIYYSQEKKKLLSHNFIYIAYSYNDKIFYKMLFERGLRLNKFSSDELKKIALLDFKYDWYSLLNKNKYYDNNSEEVIMLTENIFSF